MGKKIPVPCFGVKMIAFFSLVLEIWSFTAYFSGKRRSLLHRNTAQGSFSPLQSYSKKTLRKNVPKCAHAPWASHNTPQINSIWPPYR